MVWEQEIYNQMLYSSPQKYFHTFPADVSTASIDLSLQNLGFGLIDSTP